MELEFGTAGIRGVIGNKENNLNEAHAARVFDAYSKYLLKKYGSIDKKYVVIGRDNRKRGKRFTRLAVNILTSNGIEVFFTNKMLPTPFISFLTRTKGAIGAINITASHNPKEYNGIKLYDSTGCQLLPKEIEHIKSFFLPYENYTYLISQEVELNKNKLINNISDEDYKLYINKVLNINNIKNDLSNIKVIYSSLHGTGYEFAKEIFDNYGVDVIYESNEIMEDENFTYVKNPNPESEEAFKNSINLAKKENADLVLLTDPDSDRLGVAVKTKENNYIILTGNEVAILIINFLLENKILINNKKKQYMIYSFVSSSLPAKMCFKNGIKTYMVETGFKWIGKLIDEIGDKEEFLFAFEESYGSLIDKNIARDKDAIQGMLIILLISSIAKEKKNNLIDSLNKIYEKYGFLKSKSFSYDLHDMDELEKVKWKFSHLKFENSKLFDYNNEIRNIGKSDMIAHELGNSNWVALRPSGTEPKFKIYIHVVETTREKANIKFKEIFNKIQEITNN